MSYENQISELYFLLHKNNINEIRSRLTDILHSLHISIFANQNQNKNDITYFNHCKYLKTLYLLIGHTRDIYFGHGERDISYMMIFVWYEFFPILAIYAFERFVIGCSPYGSWNDIKYFCKFISDISDKGNDDPLIDIAVTCANNQLLLDYQSIIIKNVISNSISNISKWIPREKKNRCLFDKFVLDWFSESDEFFYDFSYQKKIYRQIISTISVSIPDNKSVSVSASAYHHVNNSELCHGNVFIGMYIKNAISIIKNCQSKGVLDFDTCPDAILLNNKWCSLLSSFSKCHYGIPLVDISSDISNESLYHAIGFASLVAIKSGIFRIMLVSSMPIWIDFTKYDSICSFVHKIWSFCEFRTCSQFSISFHLIMDTISKLDYPPSIKLFIFSQRFLFDWNWILRLSQNNISFVFWNIGDFHIAKNCNLHINDNKDILFVSGFNTCLLSKFCSDSPYVNSYIYSYSFLLNFLYSDRYVVLANYFDSYIFYDSNSSSDSCFVSDIF
jgi:hypothetical protein